MHDAIPYKLTIFKLTNSIAWFLPYAWRQTTYRVLFPADYNRLHKLRKRKTRDGYSLISFDKYQSLFVHIPKCAGLAIAMSLFGNQGGGHLSLLHYQLIYTKQEFEQYFKFAFVRNPWDRLVSAFFFLKNGGGNSEDLAWSQKHLASYRDFDGFVSHWLSKQNIVTSTHFRPQHFFVCNEKDDVLVDFLGRYENLYEDYERVRKKIQVSGELLQANITPERKKDYRSYYTPSTRAIVEKVYSRDIEIFGYTF